MRRSVSIAAAIAAAPGARSRVPEPAAVRVGSVRRIRRPGPRTRRLRRQLVQLVDFLDVLSSRRLGHRHDRQIESQQQARARRERSELPRDDFRRLAHDLAPAAPAERAPDARVQQPHVVVDLRRRPHGRARIADAVLLADGDGRRDAVDPVDVRLLHPLEELPGVCRQRLDVAPLSFGVDRVEGERRLARPADARDDDELPERKRQIDILQVVRARAVDVEVAGFERRGWRVRGF